jgi:hypothetical protein
MIGRISQAMILHPVTHFIDCMKRYFPDCVSARHQKGTLDVMELVLENQDCVGRVANKLQD